jgi:hypothetical protein
MQRLGASITAQLSWLLHEEAVGCSSGMGLVESNCVHCFTGRRKMGIQICAMTSKFRYLLVCRPLWYFAGVG